MASSTYKLIYFNVRARAEPIRFLFAVAGVPYKDVRVDKVKEWPQMKETTPWGQVPILEVDGTRIAQGAAISRFLARRFDLCGSNDIEAAKCDEYVDAMQDLRAFWRAFYFMEDGEQRKNLVQDFESLRVPFYFGKFEDILKNSPGPYLFGNKYTWADFHVAHTLDFFNSSMEADYLKSYPKLTELKNAVYSIPKIKEWIDKRPVTKL